MDSFTTAPTSGENYIFYRVRTGGVTETVQSLSSSNTFIATASITGLNGLQNGDKIYGRRINTNVIPNQDLLSEIITISIQSYTDTSTLDGGIIDQPHQLVCSGSIPQDLTVTGTSSNVIFSQSIPIFWFTAH